MDFKWIILHYVFARRMDLNPIFCPIFLSKTNMEIDYIDNVLDHENPL